MLTMPYRPMSWEASTGSAGEQVRFAVSECWLMQRVALSRLSLPGRCGGNPAKCYWLGKFRRDGIAAATLKRAECASRSSVRQDSRGAEVDRARSGSERPPSCGRSIPRTAFLLIMTYIWQFASRTVRWDSQSCIHVRRYQPFDKFFTPRSAFQLSLRAAPSG
jgi:hypothetical protein